MPEILGICGSARKKGNTALLLKEVLKASERKSELIFLSDLTIGFCTGCLSCMKNKGKCIKDDDMNMVIKKCLSSKAIVFGSPNYYYNVSGLMKNMIDRTISASYLGIGEFTGMDWHGWMPFIDKPAGFVICQAASGGEKVEETFQCLAEYSGLHVVGTLIASVGGQTVEDFPEYIEQAKDLGKKIRNQIIKNQHS